MKVFLSLLAVLVVASPMFAQKVRVRPSSRKSHGRNYAFTKHTWVKGSSVKGYTRRK